MGPAGKDGSTCTVKDNTDGTKTLSCTDGTKVEIKSGTPGKDGSSCKVTDDGKGTKTIACTDGSSVTVTDGSTGKDGKDGKDGEAGKAGADGAAGANGKSCTVKDNGDSTKTITCEDGTTATVADGKAGAGGQSCTVKDNGDGTKAINCPGDATVTVSDGKDGAAGKSCTAKDNGDGTQTVSCEDGTSVTVSDGKDGADGKEGAAGKDGAAGKSCTVKDNTDGSKTISCEDGTTATVANGTNGTNGAPGLSMASTGFTVTVKNISTVATDPIKVNFTLSDDKGYPIDVCGKYSLNSVIRPTFGLAYVTKDTGGNVLPYTVLTRSASSSAPAIANPTMFNPLGTDCKPAVDANNVTTGHGTFVQNALGDYTYTFPTADTAKGPFKVAFDATKLDNTHVLWIQAVRQVDTVNTTNSATFKAVNKEHAFIPSGNGTPLRRELVATSTCSNCHRGFAPEGTTGSSFHGSGRVEAPYCALCHSGRTSTSSTTMGKPNEAADAVVFVHRLHASHEINPKNLFHAIEFGYPQDIRNCASCHAGSLQPDQWKTRPSRIACTSCHDHVDLLTTDLAKCTIPAAVDAGGVRVPCQHQVGPKADTTCAGCHDPDAIAGYHEPVAPPDPKNIYSVPVGGNNNTNAAYLAAANVVPAGADVITYDLKEVNTWMDGNVRRPMMIFRLKQNGNPVVFQTYQAGVTTELMPKFVGSPSAYFVFAVPEDGIDTPADFNASTSAYIKNVWNGTATDIKTGTVTQGTQGTTTCTPLAPCTCGDGVAPNPAICKLPLGSLTFDAGTGYYTIKLYQATIPLFATMLTGGLGYSYGLTTTQPLTQTNVTGYDYNTTTKVGGLIVPAPNVWILAKNAAVTTGTQAGGVQNGKLCTPPTNLTATCDCTQGTCNQWLARRTIVNNDLCKKCHAQLGAAPTFHAGNRNDGPSCVWCHTPNRTSSGWGANSKDFIHAIHGARKRVVPFTWHAPAIDETYAEVEFPGALSNCMACHVSGAFDFSGPGIVAALPKLLMSTVGTGTYQADPIKNSSYYTLSPYVIADGTTSYGANFSYSASQTNASAAVGLPVDATATTLVVTPITAACAACHDSPVSIDHMQSNGGHFYEPRASVKAPGATKEQCLLCHGPGKIAPISQVHK